MATFGFNNTADEISTNCCDNSTDNDDCVNGENAADSFDSSVDESDNATNPLTIIAEIGSNMGSLSLHALNKLSRVCKATYVAVQWKIDRMKQLHEKWAPMFAPKLERYLRTSMINHPIKYTSKSVKTVSILNMGYDNIGMRVLDVPGVLDTKNRVALSNICILTRKPIPFVAMLFLNRQAITCAEITFNDYTDTGELTADQYAKVCNRYGDDIIDHPGRYFVDLKLDTRINPIVIGDPIIDPRAVRLCVAENYSTYISDDGPYTDMIFDVNIVGQFFTHMFIHFNAVDERDYKWGNYAVAFNDELGVRDHGRKASFVRRIDDPLIAPPKPDNVLSHIISPHIISPRVMDRQLYGLDLLAQMIQSMSTQMDPEYDETSDYSSDYLVDYSELD